MLREADGPAPKSTEEKPGREKPGGTEHTTNEEPDDAGAKKWPPTLQPDTRPTPYTVTEEPPNTGIREGRTACTATISSNKNVGWKSLDEICVEYPDVIGTEYGACADVIHIMLFLLVNSALIGHVVPILHVNVSSLENP